MAPSSPTRPDVSVVIPARNEERYIQAALMSVAAQTCPVALLEAVVVDNGSTDGTREVVQAFMARAPHLAVRLVDEPAHGVARAKNGGASVARGRWLIFLDADSRMAPDLVERVMLRARQGHAAGSVRVVADSHDVLDRAFFGLIEFGKVLFGLRAQMFYCERELFMQCGGFDEHLQLAEDLEFLARLQRAGIPVCHVTGSWIATSPRRLHALPCRLGMPAMLARWALAKWGLGRRWRY
jgi:cellulose synthase/poly-beta-1,6-N-acetylglucosamine synthase-like glycosyltransferase